MMLNRNDNAGLRQYVIDKIKAPLLKAILTLAKRYPEPTGKNCLDNNTLIWMDIWDEFEKRNLIRTNLFAAVRRIHLCELEHDGIYRERMNLLLELWLEKVLAGKYQPRNVSTTTRFGGRMNGRASKFLKDCYYNKGIDWLKTPMQEDCTDK